MCGGRNGSLVGGPCLSYLVLQIIVTVPVLLDLLLCHSRVWLPREESRSFPRSSSGIRDSSRAPDTRAGMTEKFDRADVPCHFLVQDSNRFRLFLTLAGIVAACSLVLVISASLLIETARANVPSYNPFSVQAIVLSFLVVITASLVWCLRKARQKPTRSGSVVFGATTFGSVAVTLFCDMHMGF